VFRAGAIVTVRRAVEGYHLVDRGMLSTSVHIPLRPGDLIEYRGPHHGEQIVVRIPQKSADQFLARVPKELERSWVDRSRFLVYLPKDAIVEFNDR